MQLQEQCISLQQAKKIKELWFKADSCYARFYNPISKEWEVYRREWFMTAMWTYAYTASELMDMFPPLFWWYSLEVHKGEKEYRVSYKRRYITNKNLAIALWDMLIYLLENNLLPITNKDE